MTYSYLEKPLDRLDVQDSDQCSQVESDQYQIAIQRSIACVLYQPEIPGNTGTLMRLAACWNAPLILIGPLGFVWSDKHLKRASMDYAQYCKPSIHDSWSDYQNHWANAPHRTIAVVPREGVSYRKFCFQPGDHLIMGSESCGLPHKVISECDHIVHIPMRKSVRSMNLAIASALVWAEGLFQTQNPFVS
jgi:tRNA (cytidine/uridine-2'-O-)-methyltransferase